MIIQVLSKHLHIDFQSLLNDGIKINDFTTHEQVPFDHHDPAEDEDNHAFPIRL